MENSIWHGCNWVQAMCSCKQFCTVFSSKAEHVTKTVVHKHLQEQGKMNRAQFFTMAAVNNYGGTFTLYTLYLLHHNPTSHIKQHLPRNKLGGKLWYKIVWYIILLHIRYCLLPSLYSGQFQVHIMLFVVEFAITFLYPPYTGLNAMQLVPSSPHLITTN